MSGARIGKVTFKSNGTTLRILPAGVEDEVAGHALNCARRAADFGKGEGKKMIAYATVTLFNDGEVFSGATFIGESGAMNRFAFAAMAAEVTRQDLIIERTAVDVFNEGMSD